VRLGPELLDRLRKLAGGYREVTGISLEWRYTTVWMTVPV
jgi:hypothetical protein